MSRAPVRLAILNDYKIVVEGLAQMLHDDPRVVLVELDHRVEVVSDVDLILVDTFGSVSGDGIDVERLVSCSAAKVVVYTWNTDPHAVARALAQGVCGYLSKELSAAELVDALRAIRDGERVVCPPAECQVEQHDASWPGQSHGLSEREAEIVALIAKGQSNQEIADSLYLSINTVKTYVRSAYSKISVTRRAQAVRWALDHGFAAEIGRDVLSPPAPGGTARPSD